MNFSNDRRVLQGTSTEKGGMQSPGGGPQTPSRTPLRSFKTVLLGDASVGKTSLVIRFVKNFFSDSTETTIGAAFFTQTLQVDKNRTLKYEIWDTAGQERFMSLAPMYYRGAAAALVVYDMTNPQSLERAKMWVDQLKLSDNPNICIALVANKRDLITSKTDAPWTASTSNSPTLYSSSKYPFIDSLQKEARQYAEEKGLLFVETSAKTGQNVVQLFTLLARALPETPPTPKRPGAPSGGDITTITLGERGEAAGSPERKCCL